MWIGLAWLAWTLISVVGVVLALMLVWDIYQDRKALDHAPGDNIKRALVDAEMVGMWLAVLVMSCFLALGLYILLNFAERQLVATWTLVAGNLLFVASLLHQQQARKRILRMPPNSSSGETS